jgi:hypothetical protein
LYLLRRVSTTEWTRRNGRNGCNGSDRTTNFIVAIVAIVASQQFEKWRSRKEFPAIKGAWGCFPNKAKQAISREMEIACFCEVGTALPSLRLLYRVLR